MPVPDVPSCTASICRTVTAPVGMAVAPVLSLVMLSLTFAHWRSEERASSERREIDLRVAADRMAYNLADRMASYELVLRGLGGTSKAPERIDREEFQTYVRSCSCKRYGRACGAFH